MKPHAFVANQNHTLFVQFVLFTIIISSFAQDSKSDKLRRGGVEKLSKGQFQEAISDLQMAVESNDTDYTAMYNLATAYLANRNIRMAKRTFYDVLNIRDDFVKAKIHLSALCVREGQFDEALKVMNIQHDQYAYSHEKIKELKQKSNHAQFAHSTNDFETSKKLYHELIEVCNLAVEFYEKRADCYFELNQQDLSIEDLKHVTRLQPENTGVMFRIYEIYMLNGQLNEALRWIKNCLVVDQENEQCRPPYRILKQFFSKIKKINDAIEKEEWNECMSQSEDLLMSLNQTFADARISIALKLKCKCSLHVRDDKEIVVSICTKAIDSSAALDLDCFLTRAEAFIILDRLDDAKADYSHLKRNGLSEGEEGLRQIEKLIKQKGKKDYYKILGVPRNAKDKEIKTAFRKLAMKYHPDKQNSPTEKAKAEIRFREISDAKEVLTDPEKRKRFDRGEDPLDHTTAKNPFEGFQNFHGFDSANQGFTFTFNFG